MTGWLQRHAQAIQAAGALVTSGATLAALVFVPWQIIASDRIGREQAAREIYREYLNISIHRPGLAMGGSCAPADPAERAAYESYVDYLLYTAEQVLTLGPEDWRSTILARLEPHVPHLCRFDDSDLDTMTPAVAALVTDITGDCAAVVPCAAGAP